MKAQIAGFSLSVIMLFGLISIAVILSQEEPVKLEAQLKPCIGSFLGNICLIGSQAVLAVTIESDMPLDGNITKEVIIESEITGEPHVKTVVVGEEQEIEIPISADLEEGQYKITISTDIEDFGRLLLKMKHFIQSMLGYTPAAYLQKEDIDIKYPEIRIATTSPSCTQNGVYIEEIKLKLEEQYLTSLNCKLRVKINRLVTTTHSGLTVVTEDDLYFNYYDTEYSEINKEDLVGAIQKVRFTSEPSIGQIDTTLIPTCIINEHEIQIVPYIETLKRCKVNQER